MWLAILFVFWLALVIHRFCAVPVQVGWFQQISWLQRYRVAFESWVNINFWYRTEAAVISNLLSAAWGEHVPLITVADAPLFLSSVLLAAGGAVKAKDLQKSKKRMAICDA